MAGEDLDKTEDERERSDLEEEAIGVEVTSQAYGFENNFELPYNNNQLYFCLIEQIQKIKY